MRPPDWLLGGRRKPRSSCSSTGSSLSRGGHRTCLTRVREYDFGTTRTELPMTLTATKPHPIYLAGKWVESPDTLTVDNPAAPDPPPGPTSNPRAAQPEQ